MIMDATVTYRNPAGTVSAIFSPFSFNCCDNARIISSGKLFQPAKEKRIIILALNCSKELRNKKKRIDLAKWESELHVNFGTEHARKYVCPGSCQAPARNISNFRPRAEKSLGEKLKSAEITTSKTDFHPFSSSLGAKQKICSPEGKRE